MPFLNAQLHGQSRAHLRAILAVSVSTRTPAHMKDWLQEQQFTCRPVQVTLKSPSEANKSLLHVFTAADV